MFLSRRGSCLLGKMEQESWVEWTQRCAHAAEVRALLEASIDDWVVAQCCCKWRLAGHTAKRAEDCWSEVLLGRGLPCSNRGRGHPCKRWTNDLDSFFYKRDGGPWWICKFVAHDQEKWQALEDYFVVTFWHR